MTSTTNTPDKLSRIIMLTFGTMDHGGPYWCYVAIKPSRYDEFRKEMASLRYNMQHFEQDDFGEVVVSGEGNRPPKEVTRQVAQMFDVPVNTLFKDKDPDQTIRDTFEAFEKEANNQ